MHFGVAQRFAALIAGVRQTSVKLRAEAAAGLPRSVRGHAGLWGGMFSERGGGFVLCTARRVFIRFRETSAHRGACVLRPRAACSFRFRGAAAHRSTCVLRPSAARTAGSKRFGYGELAYIEAVAFCVRAPRVQFAFGELARIEDLLFCVQAARVSNIRAVESDCMTGGRDYEFRVFDPTAPIYQKITKNLLKICSQSEQYVIK